LGYAQSTIDDYAAEGSAEAAYSAYDGQQTGNPVALGEVLIQLGTMETPPKQFMAKVRMRSRRSSQCWKGAWRRSRLITSFRQSRRDRLIDQIAQIAAVNRMAVIRRP